MTLSCGFAALKTTVASAASIAKTRQSDKKLRRTKLMNILPGNMRFWCGQGGQAFGRPEAAHREGAVHRRQARGGALWLYLLRSPHAHAKIASIDTKPAAEMPGVEAVYTGADLITDDIGTIPTLSIFKRPDGKPMTVAAAAAARP